MNDIKKMEAIVACLDCTIHNAEWANKTYTACDVEFLKLVLDILKAQEPRVMAMEDIPENAFGWIETRSTGELVPAVLEDVFADGTVGWATIEDGHDYYDANSYIMEWRCWTSRPTDEQREATPWD